MRSHNAYITQRFDACIVRYGWAGARATLLLSRNGKTVCVGVKTIEEALLALHTLRLELHDYGYETCFAQFRDVNSVNSFNANNKVDLAGLFRDNQDKAGWEPELFPGLKLVPGEGPVVRVFDSGRCVVMGGGGDKNRAAATQHVRELLAEYRDDNVPDSAERFEYRRRRRKLVMYSGDSPRPRKRRGK